MPFGQKATCVDTYARVEGRVSAALHLPMPTTVPKHPSRVVANSSATLPGDIDCISVGFDYRARRPDFYSVGPLWHLLAAQTPSLPEGVNLNWLRKAAVIQSTARQEGESAFRRE